MACESHGYAKCGSRFSLYPQHVTANGHTRSRLPDSRTGRELNDDKYLRALLKPLPKEEVESSGAQVIKYSDSLESFATCVHTTNHRAKGVLNPRLTPSFHAIDLDLQASRFLER